MVKTRRERRSEAVERLRKIEYASSLGDPANDNGRTPVEVACGKQLMSYKDECYDLIDLLSEDECEDVSGNDLKFRCSVCGAQIDVTDQDGESTMWDANGDATWPSHCPNCGARVAKTRGDGSSFVVPMGPESETMGLETDNREKLEADVCRYFRSWIGGAQRTQEVIRGWLDRQAAITASECSDDWRRYKRGADEEVARLTKERDELKEELDNSVGLPKDADGETIRLGDMVQYRDEKPFAVTMISYYPNIAGKVFWRINGAGTPVYEEGRRDELHHYHAPTVADVLTDFAREYDDIGGAPDEEELWAKMLSKYAEKLRLSLE